MAKRRRNEWAGVMITEDNVDAYIEHLLVGSARHITQGVSFAKADEKQLRLLKLALLEYNSFSGLVKHLLEEYFRDREDGVETPVLEPILKDDNNGEISDERKKELEVEILRAESEKKKMFAEVVEEHFGEYASDFKEKAEELEKKAEEIEIEVKQKRKRKNLYEDKMKPKKTSKNKELEEVRQ